MAENRGLRSAVKDMPLSTYHVTLETSSVQAHMVYMVEITRTAGIAECLYGLFGCTLAQGLHVADIISVKAFSPGG